MLPLLGPSDDLHVAGRVADRALEPWTYIDDLSLVSGGVTFNRLSGQAESIVRFIKTEPDSYETLKYFWTFSSKKGPPDWSLSAPKDPASLQTLNVAAIEYDDPEFAYQGREASVRIPSTGKKMKFNYWFYS